MNSAPENSEQPEEQTSLRPLHRGVWAVNLTNGEHLPVGGSMFSDNLTTFLELDFATFIDQLQEVDEKRIRAIYEERKEQVIEWLKHAKYNVDPYLFFVCTYVQNVMHRFLEVDTPEKINSSERMEVYSDNKDHPKLSQLKGKSACGERAALGQYILQKLGIQSAYVGGVTMNDAHDEGEYPEAHSYLVLTEPDQANETVIFDIARPKRHLKVPRLLKTDVPLNYDLLKNRNELFIEAEDVLDGKSLWFGVGDPVCGTHKIVKSKPGK